MSSIDFAIDRAQRFLARLRRRHEVRLAGERLRRLDDHLLRDIGIERGSIERLVRRGRG